MDDDATGIALAREERTTETAPCIGTGDRGQRNERQIFVIIGNSYWSVM
jgi:hypothetical protein